MANSRPGAGRWLIAFSVAALLAACQPASDSEAAEQTPDAAEIAAAPVDYQFDDTIECALSSGQWFVPECRVQRVKQDDGSMVLVVRHPDGGFRRFLVLTDGRGLEPADGSELAVSEFVDGRLDISVGADRYRFPATAKPEGQGGTDGASANQ